MNDRVPARTVRPAETAVTTWQIPGCLIWQSPISGRWLGFHPDVRPLVTAASSLEVATRLEAEIRDPRAVRPEIRGQEGRHARVPRSNASR